MIAWDNRSQQDYDSRIKATLSIPDIKTEILERNFSVEIQNYWTF